MGRADWTADLVGLAHHKETKALLREAQRRGGWIGRHTGGHHIQLKHRSGALVVLSSSPTRPSSVPASRSYIRQAERRYA